MNDPQRAPTPTPTPTPTPEQRLLVRHMRKHPGALLCPVCGSKDWTIGKPGVLLGWNKPNNIKDTEVTPIIPIICRVCAFMRTFSLLLLEQMYPDE